MKKVSTEDTKKMTGLDNSGIRKIRKIYQEKGRLKPRELFSEKQVDEIKLIVQYQRCHPHSSYRIAYEAIMTQKALNFILKEQPDDLTGRAILVMGGEEKLDYFFKLCNALTDFLKDYDSDSVQVLTNLQSLILAKIASKQSN